MQEENGWEQELNSLLLRLMKLKFIGTHVVNLTIKECNFREDLRAVCKIIDEYGESHFHSDNQSFANSPLKISCGKEVTLDSMWHFCHTMWQHKNKRKQLLQAIICQDLVEISPGRFWQRDFELGFFQAILFLKALVYCLYNFLCLCFVFAWYLAIRLCSKSRLAGMQGPIVRYPEVCKLIILREAEALRMYSRTRTTFCKLQKLGYGCKLATITKNSKHYLAGIGRLGQLIKCQLFQWPKNIRFLSVFGQSHSNFTLGLQNSVKG